MAASFRILSDRGIVYIRYSGFTTTEESLQMMQAYGRHADFRPGQSTLCDFRDVEDYDLDYVKIIEHQSEIADIVLPETVQVMLVLLADKPKGREIANLIQKSWAGVAAIVPVIVDTEDHALEVLGQPERRIADFLDAREKN